MFCRKCGNRLNENDTYCSSCGEKVLRVIPQPTDTNVPQNVQRNKSRGSKIAFAIGIVTISIILVICIVLPLSNTDLAGTWVCSNEVSGYPDGMVLQKDGNAIVDGYDCVWYAEDGIIYFEDISLFVSDKEYHYKIKGSKLYLDGFEYSKND